MKTIKFRIYDPVEKVMRESGATPMMLHSFFEGFATLNTVHKIEFQQFTGLHDKNGKMIYEGDIIDFGGETCYVVFENGRFLLKGDTRSYAMWSHINDKKVNNGIEIIGNIYENPELIK